MQYPPTIAHTPHGKLMITVLGGLAEFERHLILSWTYEGRQRAKANGIKFGRKPKLNKHQGDEALARKRNGETLTEIAKTYNVSHMTLAGSDWSTRTAAFSAVSDRRGSSGVARHMHSGSNSNLPARADRKTG